MSAMDSTGEPDRLLTIHSLSGARPARSTRRCSQVWGVVRLRRRR